MFLKSNTHGSYGLGQESHTCPFLYSEMKSSFLKYIRTLLIHNHQRHNAYKMVGRTEVPLKHSELLILMT
jgi:hypothetical protein